MKLIYWDSEIDRPEKLSTSFGEGSRSMREAFLDGVNRFGMEIFDRIEGGFALVFEDRAKQRIVAARDPLGIRPLYCLRHEGEWFFAGSIDRLLSQSGIAPSIDRESMRSVYVNASLAWDRTMYREIRRIPPGHLLEISRGTARLRRYWFPECIKTNGSLRLVEAAARFRKLLQEALERRQRGANETAFELSGGLDSSSLYALAVHASDRCPAAYTFGYEGWECDEIEFVRSFEKNYRCRSTILSLPAFLDSPEYSLIENYRLNPHWPQITSSSMYLPLTKRLKSDAKRVLITGQGGDQLLVGSCKLLGDLLRRGKVGAFFRELASFVDGPIAWSPSCLSDLLPRRPGRAQRHSEASGGSRGEWMEGFVPFGRGISGVAAHRLGMLLSPRESFLRDASHSHAIEARYKVKFCHPFFDRRLVKFVLSLPPEYLYSRGWTKLLLRFALEGILPDPILSRRDKAEFSPLLRCEIEALDPQILEVPSLVALGLVDAKEQKERMEGALQGDPSRILSLWQAVNLELWYRFGVESVAERV